MVLLFTVELFGMLMEKVIVTVTVVGEASQGGVWPSRGMISMLWLLFVVVVVVGSSDERVVGSWKQTNE